MNADAAIPLRALLGLTAAVLAAHVWLLRGAPQRMQAREPARVPTFATRAIAPPAPADEPKAAAKPATKRTLPAPAVPAPAPVRAAATARQAEPRLERHLARGLAPQRRTLAAAPSGARADTGPAAQLWRVPGPVQLHYRLTGQTRGQPWQGRGELVWRHDGAGYEAQLASDNGAQPPRLQHSAGAITPQGLAPLRFSEKGRTEQAAHFERAAQRVVFSNNRPAAPLLAGAQDRLSVLLQLSAMLAGEPRRYPPGTSISIQTAGIREAETWVFAVGPQEPLDLPGGATPAIRLDRPPRHEFDQRIELWLAPGQDYVPVRLRLTQANGDWVDHQWSSTDRR